MREKLSSLNFPGENWEPRGDGAGWEALICAGLGAPGSRAMETRTRDVVVPSLGEQGPMADAAEVVHPRPSRTRVLGASGRRVSPQQSPAVTLRCQPTSACLCPLSF